MIYIDLCIQKSILKGLGVSYLWVEGPQESRLLAGLTLNTQKEGHSTRPVGEILLNNPSVQTQN